MVCNHVRACLPMIILALKRNFFCSLNKCHMCVKLLHIPCGETIFFSRNKIWMKWHQASHQSLVTVKLNHFRLISSWIAQIFHLRTWEDHHQFLTPRKANFVLKYVAIVTERFIRADCPFLSNFKDQCFDRDKGKLEGRTCAAKYRCSPLSSCCLVVRGRSERS